MPNDNPSPGFFHAVATASNMPATATAGVSPSPSQPAASRPGVMASNGLGMVRYQSGADTEAPVTGPQRMQPTSSVIGGVSRMTVTDGRTTVESEAGVTRAEQHKPGGSGQSAISTIRSAMGSPRSGSDVRPSDIITVAGMETSVAAAVAAGFIVRNADGSYSDAGSSKVASPTPQAQQQPQEQKAED